MVIRAGENVCAIFMHKKAPCRLFGTGAMAQPEVFGLLRREAELPLRAGIAIVRYSRQDAHILALS